jgi:hypothetical protein
MTNSLEVQLDTTQNPEVDQQLASRLRQQQLQVRPLAAGDQSHWDASTSSVLRMMSTHTEGEFA